MLPLFSRFHSIKLRSRHPPERARKSAAPPRGYLAARELHWYRSFRVVHSSEPQTAKTTPASVIVSNSSDKVLPDLARMLHPPLTRPLVLPYFRRFLRPHSVYFLIP